jgi:hypothetical protein
MQYNLGTNFNLDFKLDAFVIMNDIFFLANLSIIDITFDNLDVASFISCYS